MTLFLWIFLTLLLNGIYSASVLDYDDDDNKNKLLHESIREDDCHQAFLKDPVFNQEGYIVRPVVLKIIPEWLITINERTSEQLLNCEQHLSTEEYVRLLNKDDDLVSKAKKVLRSLLRVVDSYRTEAEKLEICNLRSDDSEDVNYDETGKNIISELNKTNKDKYKAKDNQDNHENVNVNKTSAYETNKPNSNNNDNDNDNDNNNNNNNNNNNLKSYDVPPQPALGCFYSPPEETPFGRIKQKTKIGIKPNKWRSFLRYATPVYDSTGADDDLLDFKNRWRLDNKIRVNKLQKRSKLKEFVLNTTNANETLRLSAIDIISVQLALLDNPGQEENLAKFEKELKLLKEFFARSLEQKNKSLLHR